MTLHITAIYTEGSPCPYNCGDIHRCFVVEPYTCITHTSIGFHFIYDKNKAIYCYFIYELHFNDLHLMYTVNLNFTSFSGELFM